MNQKIRVGILFGGKSAEHEVSLQSARNIVDAIDETKYEVVLVSIDKKGRWQLNDAPRLMLAAESSKLTKLNRKSEKLALIPGEKNNPLIKLADFRSIGSIDVIFPVLHGPFGEDGTIQGLLKLANVPFVGAGVLGSAVGMDKDVMKRLLKEAGIPVAKFFVFNNTTRNELNFREVTQYLGLPFFVKPANLGSSVGINKVDNEKEFPPAIQEAFNFDKKIVIEEYIQGREIECSVLGNENPIASLPGEILTNVDKHQFYNYKAKYIDGKGAVLEIPAKLPREIVPKIQELAIETFKVLCCEGMARVDFFLKKDGQIIVNELNTIPGFTKISMYPKLWEVSGISYTELIDKLIQFALDRFEDEKKIRTAIDL
jgi:D-alanine-D-alanine ligase